MPCASATTNLSWAIPLAAVLCVLLTFALYQIYYSPPPCLMWASVFVHRLLAIGHKIGWAKLKILVAFLQIPPTLESTYGVTLPSRWSNFASYVQFVDIPWRRALGYHEECLSHEPVGRLLFAALIPLTLPVLVLLYFEGRALWELWRARRRAIRRQDLSPPEPLGSHGPRRSASTPLEVAIEEASLSIPATERDSSVRVTSAVLKGFRWALPAVLAVVYVFIASVSRTIFESWACFSVAIDDVGAEISYLQSDLSLVCYSPEHDRLLAVAGVMVAAWPIGAVLLYGGLLLYVRNQIRAGRVDATVQATSFLHNDTTPQAFYWEVVDLVRRSLLTGWVLLLRHTTMRLLLATFVTLCALVWLLIARPYRRVEDNVLGASAQLILLTMLVCSTYFKFFTEVAKVDSPLAHRLTGITDANVLVDVLLVATAVMLLAVAVIAVVAVRAELKLRIIRVKKTGTPPRLTLAPGHVFHIFLSHVWGTGQTTVANIKQSLQLLLPGVRAFRDLDDLKDIGQLEEYVEQSACILVFLSRGYLLSRNCQRELHSALTRRKPLCLVHELNLLKGGLSLIELRDEFASLGRHFPPLEGLQPGHEASLIMWSHIPAFQLVSLRRIAEALLAASPTYLHAHFEGDLTLIMPGEESPAKLALGDHVALVVSPANEGAHEAAEELAALDSGICIFTELPAPVRAKYELLMQQAGAPRGSTSRRSPSPRLGPRLSRASSPRTASKVASAAAATSTKSVFFLYLNKAAFVGERGEELAAQVRAVRAAGLELVMAHETDVEHPVRRGCEFAHFFVTTPADLITDGLYKALAITLAAEPEQRSVSHALILRALGASSRMRTSQRLPRFLVPSVVPSMSKASMPDMLSSSNVSNTTADRSATRRDAGQAAHADRQPTSGPHCASREAPLDEISSISETDSIHIELSQVQPLESGAAVARTETSTPVVLVESVQVQVRRCD